ncbi:hypothetical protein CAL7716_058070 [Calothrix sp. PCC 7716]|nr:hypothetical protein CAL7716_058070 [Calothrix sp. PCC 7716]
MQEKKLEPTETVNPSQIVIEYCKKYERHHKLAATSFRCAYFISQFAAVVFSGITPILILMDSIPKSLQAIPPAIASISAGLSVYNWRLSSVRSARAATLLENERLNFELRIGESYSQTLPDDTAIANFRKNVMQVQTQVLDDWEKIVIKDADSQNILNK